MRKLLLIIVFTMTTILSVQAVEYDKDTKKFREDIAVYSGNPLKNKIVSSGDMYSIIFNPSELSFRVMQLEARKYCKKSLGNNWDL